MSDKNGLLIEYLSFFGAKYFIYNINRSIATKVDSTYLSYSSTEHNRYVFDDW